MYQSLKLQYLEIALPTLLVWSLPISTALTNICVILLTFLWLLTGNFKEKWEDYWRHPITLPIWLLFGYYLFGGFYSLGNEQEILERFRDGMRLCYIPILIYYFRRPGFIRLAFAAFISAMCITFLVSLLKIYANVPIGQKYTEAAVFKNHIDTNFFMAIAAFYSFFIAYHYPKFKQLYWVCFFLLFYTFFLSAGRIGYLAVFLIVNYFGYHHYGKKGAALSLALMALVAVCLYCSSDVFHGRIAVLSQDWDFFKEGRLDESSLGSRLKFYLTSFQLILMQPWLGWGTGSFSQAYATFCQGNYIFTDNPHNEYFLVAVEHGLLGLSLLVFFFWRQWNLYTQLASPWFFLARASLLVFLVGCFINSWLTDFTSCYYFVILSAMSLSQIKSLPNRSRSLAKLQ